MTQNGKRLAIATLIELAVRTTSKVQIKQTKRGFQKLDSDTYGQACMAVKNELTTRGMLDV